MWKSIMPTLGLAATVIVSAMPAEAQGLMSGTGMQPSQQLATPPDAPAIDRPGAEQKSLDERARDRSVRPMHPHGTGTSGPNSRTGSSATGAANSATNQPR